MTYFLARVFFTTSLALSFITLMAGGGATGQAPMVTVAIWGLLSLLTWSGFMVTWITTKR